MCCERYKGQDLIVRVVSNRDCETRVYLISGCSISRAKAREVLVFCWYEKP